MQTPAHRASRELQKSVSEKSPFWEREYYDRLIRNAAEFGRPLEYVRANPERANLKGWKWVWCAGEDAPTTAGEDASATVSAGRPPK